MQLVSCLVIQRLLVLWSGLSPVTRYTVSVQPVLGASLQRADTTVTITVQTLPPGQSTVSVAA